MVTVSDPLGTPSPVYNRSGVTIGNSLVTSAKQDQRNVGLCAAESLGYFSLCHRPLQHADFGDFLTRQELIESGDDADVNRVLFVGPVIDPFEIGYDVIPFVSIDVIDHREIVRIGDEGCGNESMDENVLCLSVSPQTRSCVSKAMDTEMKDSSLNSLRAIRPVADSIQAAEPSEIGNFVKVSKSVNRDGSPFFGESDIHSTGCPSGEVRLTIKDPSFVATFGGSAHYGQDLRYLQ